MPFGSTSTDHIIAPKGYEIQNKIPDYVHTGYQTQAIPYAQYETNSIYIGGNSLWIQGATDWSQYAIVPKGAFLSLLAITSTGGNGYLYEIYPGGRLLKNNYYFYKGYNQMGFYADAIGQHILLYVIENQASNPIVVDVVESYYPPHQPPYQSPYYQLPYYQPSYYPPRYYPSSQSPIYEVPSHQIEEKPATTIPLTTSNQPPSITSFAPDQTSPQQTGTRIRWTTETRDPDGDGLYFRYLVKGPETGGVWKDQSSWIPDKYWSWLTDRFEPGRYHIQVQVRDKYHAGENCYDDARIADFTIN